MFRKSQNGQSMSWAKNWSKLESKIGPSMLYSMKGPIFDSRNWSCLTFWPCFWSNPILPAERGRKKRNTRKTWIDFWLKKGNFWTKFWLYSKYIYISISIHIKYIYIYAAGCLIEPPTSTLFSRNLRKRSAKMSFCHPKPRRENCTPRGFN